MSVAASFRGTFSPPVRKPNESVTSTHPEAATYQPKKENQ